MSSKQNIRRRKKERAKKSLKFCLTLHKLSKVNVNSPLNMHTISEIILKKYSGFIRKSINKVELYTDKTSVHIRNQQQGLFYIVEYFLL